MPVNNYYDVDDFLAEEERVPCTTFFDFSYLAHLDPDNITANNKDHLLPEKSKLKMPIWSLHKWADLGFVRLQLPKHYNRKARELLAADPANVSLRESYFFSGTSLIRLCERSAKRNMQNLGRRRNAQLPRLEALLQDCQALRTTLLHTYTGERLCQTLDWALSSVGDDVSSYVTKLTAMERRLYRAGAVASASHTTWKLYSNSRLVPQHHNMSSSNRKKNAATAAVQEEEERQSKRSRTN